MSDHKEKGKEKEVEDGKLDEEGIPFAKEDLPYGGDRLKALRAQDRKAITLIMRWGNKYGKIEVIRDRSESSIPEIAKECNNNEDYISHEVWTDNNKPDIFIKYMKNDGTFEGTFCYKSGDINTMINSSQNNFTAWVRTKPEATFDDNGFIVLPDVEQNEYNKYAEPSIVELFVELPVRRFFMKNVLIQIMESLSEGPNKLVAIPAYKTRVGNVQGSYGSGQLHGQEPDRTIYFLVKQNYYNDQIDNGSIFEAVYKYIYYVKTGIVLSDELENITLESVQNLQIEYPTAEKDIDYYWNEGLPPHEDVPDDANNHNIIDTNDIIELELDQWIYNPNDEVRLDGKILYIIHYIYNKGDIIQYESEGLGNPEGLYISPYLKNASIVTAGDTNPNMNNFLSVFEALYHSNEILTTYKIASDMIPQVENMVEGTLKSSIDDNLEESGLQQNSISATGSWLYLIGNMFLNDITMWLLLDNNGAVLDLVFGTSYTYMYLTQSENYIRISKWNDIPSNVDLPSIVDRIISDNTIRDNALKMSYYIRETFDDDINNIFGVLLISLYYTSNIEVGIRVDVSSSGTSNFVKLDALVDGPPEYIAHAEDLFSHTEQSNIDMLAKNSELLNVMFKMQEDVYANGYITNSSGIKAKIVEQLQAGKTLVLKHPTPWEYKYDKNLDMEDNSIVKVTYKQGDVIDIPHTELIILFTTNDDFRTFIGVGTPHNLEDIIDVLDDYSSDDSNIYEYSDSEDEEEIDITKYIHTQRKVWLDDPDEENRIQGMVLYCIFYLYNIGKVLQFDSVEVFTNQGITYSYLKGASFKSLSDLDPNKINYNIYEALNNSDKIIETYRIAKGLDSYSVNTEHESTLANDVSQYLGSIGYTDENVFYIGNLINLVKYMFEQNVLAWIL